MNDFVTPADFADKLRFHVDLLTKYARLSPNETADLVKDLRLAANREEARSWILADERQPTHIEGVLGRVTGGPLHQGEDYTAVVYYIPNAGGWRESAFVGEEPGDIDVTVSKWMELPEDAVPCMRSTPPADSSDDWRRLPAGTQFGAAPR